MTRLEQCHQIEELLPLYADGDVSAEERRLIEEHLQCCPDCRSTLRYIRRADEIVGNWPEMPEDMLSRQARIDKGVCRRIRETRPLPPQGAVGHTLNLAASLALVLVAAALVLGVYAVLSQLQAVTGPVHVGPQLGKVAYVQAGDIWVKELPEGEARRITQDGNNDTPLWSPSGEWLAFRKGKQVWVARASGADAHQVQGDDVGLFSWSPISDHLAYVTTEGLQVVNADGSDKRELAKSCGGFAWSPDGQWLAFERAEQVGQQPPTSQGLWRMRADGTDMQPVYLNPNPLERQSRLAGWSPDGQYLLFWSGMLQSSSLAADGLPLMLVPASGGTPVEMTQAMLVNSDYLDWSPDGQQLAFVDGGGRMSWDNKRLAVADTAGEQRVLSEQGRADLFPAWSPDGRLIAYTSAPTAPGVGGGDPAKQAMAQRHIWVMAPDGSGKRELTDDPAYRDERPRWSKDGAFVLFARIKDEQVQVWTMRSDGSEQRLVADDLSVPATGVASPSIWFGYYGNSGWRQLYDWWQPTAQRPQPTVATPAPTQPAAFTREQAIIKATAAAKQSAPGMNMREIRIDDVTAELMARARFTFDPQPPAWASQDTDVPVWWVVAKGHFRWEGPHGQNEQAPVYEADERYFIYDSRNGDELGSGVPSARQVSPTPGAQPARSVEYRNDQYGFAVELPASWAGFATVVAEWQGDAIGPGGEIVLGAERGPMISIRHPQWTTEKPRQDIPLIVLTLAQWNSLQEGEFHIGAAPVNPRELGRNTRYVFALPARYNYAFPEGFEEVEQILQGQPLRTFEPSAEPSPFTEQYEITEEDNGKTFFYHVTTRFTIILNQDRYPREDLKVACGVSGGLAELDAPPAAEHPLYSVRYMAVRPGRCTLTNGDFSVTIEIVETPQALTPSAAAKACDICVG